MVVKTNKVNKKLYSIIRKGLLGGNPCLSAEQADIRSISFFLATNSLISIPQALSNNAIIGLLTAESFTYSPTHPLNLLNLPRQLNKLTFN